MWCYQLENTLCATVVVLSVAESVAVAGQHKRSSNATETILNVGNKTYFFFLVKQFFGDAAGGQGGSAVRRQDGNEYLCEESCYASEASQKIFGVSLEKTRFLCSKSYFSKNILMCD